MIVAGTDEVGYGCLAGPLIAVTVVLEAPSADLQTLKEWWPLPEVTDSKKIREDRRGKVANLLSEFIIGNGGEVGVGVAQAKEFDTLGYTETWAKALADSVDAATKEGGLRPDLLIVDGTNTLQRYPFRQVAVTKADSTYFPVAAASVLAKVLRDDLMRELDLNYPEYGWEQNKGYGTQQHIQAIRRLGLTTYHRKKPCETALGKPRRGGW